MPSDGGATYTLGQLAGSKDPTVTSLLADQARSMAPSIWQCEARSDGQARHGMVAHQIGQRGRSPRNYVCIHHLARPHVLDTDTCREGLFARRRIPRVCQIAPARAAATPVRPVCRCLACMRFFFCHRSASFAWIALHVRCLLSRSQPATTSGGLWHTGSQSLYGLQPRILLEEAAPCRRALVLCKGRPGASQCNSAHVTLLS